MKPNGLRPVDDRRVIERVLKGDTEAFNLLVQQWEKQYEAGKLTQAAGRRTVSPEQAEITRLRAELSRAKMEVSILKKAAVYFAKESE